MRDIKFRAWNPEAKIMLYDFDQKIIEVPLGKSIHLCIYKTGLFYKSLMQYTGLKDKNGKEIFEGDIDDRKRVCEYFPNLGCFGFKSPKHSAITFLGQFITSGNVIIGNIYENPELL